jgi:hypothetical protein
MLGVRMDRVIAEFKGYRYVTTPKSEEDIMRLLEDILESAVNVKIERINGFHEIRDIKPVRISFPYSKGEAPPSEAIEEFILKQPNYTHDIYMIFRYFLGRTIKANPKNMAEKRLFDVISKKTDRVRKKISEREPNGVWRKRKMGFSQPKVYSFVKN